MTDSKTFLEVCDSLPPCLVRAMAMVERVPNSTRIGWRLLTNDEIAERGGLSSRMVQRISSSDSWDGIKIGCASRYLLGCGVDIVNREWLEKFVSTFADHGFPHISDSRQRHLLYKKMKWPDQPIRRHNKRVRK